MYSQFTNAAKLFFTTIVVVAFTSVFFSSSAQAVTAEHASVSTVCNGNSAKGGSSLDLVFSNFPASSNLNSASVKTVVDGHNVNYTIVWSWNSTTPYTYPIYDLQPDTYQVSITWHDSRGTPGSMPPTSVVMPNCSDTPTVGIANAGSGRFWIAGKYGVLSFNGAPYFGPKHGIPPGVGYVVSIASLYNHTGYYLLTSKGDVLSYGDAQNFGSELGKTTATFVGIAVAVNDTGYVLDTLNGGHIKFGNFNG